GKSTALNLDPAQRIRADPQFQQPRRGMRNIESIESVKGLISGGAIEVKLPGRILMHPGKVRHQVSEIAFPRVRKVDNFAGADLVTRGRSRLIDSRRRARHID